MNVLSLLLAVTLAPAPPAYLRAPSVTTHAKHDPKGVTILPNGRWLKPVGRHFPVGKWPYGHFPTDAG